MPFDFEIPARGSWDVSDKTPRERLVMLRDFLRTPTPNVAWDFECADCEPECGTAGCAYGWYGYLTNQSMSTYHDVFCSADNSAEREFNLSFDDASELFSSGLPQRLNRAWSEITPADVANAIDKYLGENQ